MLIVVVGAGVLGWHSLDDAQTGEQSLQTEQASASAPIESPKSFDPSPHSAVVIGLRSDSPQGSDSSTYRTLFVAPKDERLAYLGEGEGIWMPFGPNFWQIEADQDAQGKGTQTLVALKSGKRQPASGAAGTQDALIKLRRSEKLLFAGNKYVSILQTTHIDQDGNAVEQSRTLVNQVADLDPAVRANDADALNQNRFTLSESLGAQDSSLDFADWAIAREDHQWVAKQPVSENGLVEVSDIPKWPTVPVQLTEAVDKDIPLAMSWSEVQSLEPDAKDAFTSQNEDVVIIVTDDSIELYPYRMPKAERNPVSIAIGSGESVVMVQWATEQKYVDGWKQLFGKWFKAPAR